MPIHSPGRRPDRRSGSGPVVIDGSRYRALLVDLDGVITDTATIHAAAWRRLFDDYLARRPPRSGENHRPFTQQDYLSYVDGKPRLDGVVDFLRSRGIDPDETDTWQRRTAAVLAAVKDTYFRDALDRDGVTVFDGTIDLLRSARGAGLLTAVISASRNCARVLDRAALTGMFDFRLDGAEAERRRLAGKPNPAGFLEAARELGIPPRRSVVIEDALAGVAAGRSGGFGLVIGVSRAQSPDRLLEAGADRTIDSLREVAILPDNAGAAVP